MIDWYVELQKVLRDIRIKTMDALELLEKKDRDRAQQVNEYLKADYKRLDALWKQKFSSEVPSYLGRHIGFGMDGDYRDILKRDLFDIENTAQVELLKFASKQGELGFEQLLHPAIKKSSYQQYRDGHLREAVLNSVIAIFDQIRKMTGIAADGDALVSNAFSLEHPIIILSELETDSGQNDQKGFMQIFKGAFQGIRNPKAHSLANDLNEQKAAQYLVFASLLARRLDEAKIVKGEGKAKAVQARVTRKPTPPQRVESRPTQSDGPRLTQSLPPKIVNDAVVLLDWIQKNHNAYIQSYPSFVTIRPYLTILQQDGFIKESDVSNMDGTVFELTSLGQKTLIAAGVRLV
jgi:uncharacterized protein (TIGR02391 family)